MAKKIKSTCKKTGRKLLKLWSAILTFFFGISGMSCLYGVVMEYGMPYATFTVSGKVTSADPGTPIPGIKVSATGDNGFLETEENYTDESGDYSILFSTLGAVTMDVTMHFEDIDGTLNGSYTDEDVLVHITESDFIDTTPDNDWDDGEGTATLDVDLDPIK
ncbi:MAG: radical SAM-associated putative lipoprotein [Spirochaetales bacterium]|nr:radical SAM-associated putative lipoprotein [Spirochaetales bacterium]